MRVTVAWTRLRLFEGAAHGFEPAASEVALGARAAHGMTGVAQAAFADAGDIAELGHRQRLVEMFAKKGVEPVDDLRGTDV